MTLGDAATNILRNLLFYAIGLVALLPLKMFYWAAIRVDLFYVEPSSEMRRSIAGFAVTMLAFFCVYWWSWLRGERERDYHPVLVAAACAGGLEVLYMCWRSTRPDDPLIFAIIIVTGMLAPIGLPLLVGAIKFKVPSARTVDFTLYGTCLTLVAVALIAEPFNQYEMPDDLTSAEQAEWVEEHFPRLYLDTHRYMMSLPYEPMTASTLELSDVKEIAVDEHGRWMRANWVIKGPRHEKCQSVVTIDDAGHPVVIHKGGLTAKCWQGEDTTARFDAVGDPLPLPPPPEQPSGADAGEEE